MGQNDFAWASITTEVGKKKNHFCGEWKSIEIKR